jgi:hypothetical protein
LVNILRANRIFSFEVKMAKRKFQPAEPGEKRQKSKRSYNEEEEEEEKEELIKVSHARY